MKERDQGQCIRRVREERKIGDELVLGADLKVVTGLGVVRAAAAFLISFLKLSRFKLSTRASTMRTGSFSAISSSIL